MRNRGRARQALQLARIQRARLVDADGHVVARAAAKVCFDPPMSAILTQVRPAEALAYALAAGRTEFCLDLEAGLALSVCVIGSSALLWQRRICFARVLSGPLPAYCIGQAWHDLGVCE